MDYSTYRGRGVRKSDLAQRPIVTLPNVSEWVDDVYCINAEDANYTADEVLGDPDGVTNAPIQALANRTNYLRTRVEQLTDFLSTLYKLSSEGLSMVKAIRVQTSAVSSMSDAWLQYRSNLTTPTFKIVCSDGTTFNNPNFRVVVSEPHSATYVLRTDGISGDIDPI